RNHAEALIHSTERSLKEFGEKVSAAEKGAIESAIAELRGVASGEDEAAIKAKTEALTQASMKLGEAMYKAAQASGAAEPPPGDGQGGAGPSTSAGSSAGKGEKVVDADFEEVDDEKNKKSA
ncbi:MAG TPA: Hsp70 family protein, partial [Thermoanaerobaculia bacterium]|nr:Hsp70 family protein [Thermoanaerobaculia bacterium]